MLRRITTILMTMSIAAAAPLPVLANDNISALQVSMLGDVELSCGQLSREAGAMRDIVRDAQFQRNDTRMTNTGISAAGAVGSFLLGTATGGIGLAAAGFMAKEVNSGEEQQIEKLQDIAEQRRSFMVGIFNAKGCEGPIEHVMQDPNLFDPMQQILNVSPAAGESRVNRASGQSYNQ